MLTADTRELALQGQHLHDRVQECTGGKEYRPLCNEQRLNQVAVTLASNDN